MRRQMKSEDLDEENLLHSMSNYYKKVNGYESLVKSYEDTDFDTNNSINKENKKEEKKINFDSDSDDPFDGDDILIASIKEDDYV